METINKREAWNKGKLVGQNTAQAHGHLGHPHLPPDCPCGPRPCHVQPGHRQQATVFRQVVTDYL